MSAKRKVKAPLDNSDAGSNSNQFEKLTRLVALLVVKGEPQSDKIKTLAGAGFSNSEIAELLGVTANTVNIALHRMRVKK